MNIVIIGNGISGITAARHIRKLGENHITVISAESDYFFSRTALMYIYMGHMRFKETKPYEDWFWEKNRINLVRGTVTSIDYDSKSIQVESVDEKSHHGRAPENIPYDKLVLALGSASNKFGWPGQDLEGVQGLYSVQDLEYMESHSPSLNRAVIVGGGLIGIEMAEMFHTRHIPVTLMVRESSYWNNVLPTEEAKMVGAHIEEHGLDLRLETELKEIMGDDNGHCRSVITSKGEEIPCQYVGLTAGVHPNVNWLKGGPLEINRGIVVNDHLETNIKDIYAIGDCAELKTPKSGRRAIEAVWYTGRIMGETVAYNICGKPTVYNPGIWFNSAKFLDIEYQVYGEVPNTLPENLDTLYWQDDNGKRAIRINYEKGSEVVVGFNLMGIRYRHEVCDNWIKEKTVLSEVLKNLHLANFDPELYPMCEEGIISIYNNRSDTQIPSAKKRRWNLVHQFLNQ